MVRLLANAGCETSTRGYRPVKIVATKPTAPSAVAVKAQPLRRVRVSATAASSPMAVSTAGTVVGSTPRLLRSWATMTVHTTIATPRIAAGSASRRAIAAARAPRSPSVRTVRYVAPCSANRATTARPAITVYALNRSKKSPEN